MVLRKANCTVSASIDKGQVATQILYVWKN